MPASLIVFDLDGTLIDSAPDLHRAVNRMLADFGGAPLELRDVRAMIGDGAGMLIGRALAARECTAHAPEALARFLQYYGEEPTVLTQPYPGVPQTLERLRAQGRTLAVCTNKPAGLSNTILRELALERYFSRVIGGDSLPFRKPDPRMLTELLTGFATAAAAAVLVGDSEVDAATAHAAGVPFVLMTYGYRRGPVEGISSLAAVDHFADLTVVLND